MTTDDLKAEIERLKYERDGWWQQADIASRQTNDALNEAARQSRCADALELVLREALNSRAPDYVDAAYPGWHKRARAALAQQEPDQPADTGAGEWTEADIKPGTVVRPPNGVGERWIIGYSYDDGRKIFTLVSKLDGLEVVWGSAANIAHHLNESGMISCGDPRYQPADAGESS
jgi:hypothetical protein